MVSKHHMQLAYILFFQPAAWRKTHISFSIELWASIYKVKKHGRLLKIIVWSLAWLYGN